MSECIPEHRIHRYYKQLARQSEDNKKKENKDLIKMSIKIFMSWNKGKYVFIILQMGEYINISFLSNSKQSILL